MKVIAGPSHHRYAMFRLSKNALKIFRRAQRLFYLSHSSVDALNTMNVSYEMQGYEFEKLSCAAGPGPSPGLLVLFEKLRFQQYACCRKSSVFASMDKFHKFEAAMELWCLRANTQAAGNAAADCDDDDDDDDDDVVFMGVGENGVLVEEKEAKINLGDLQDIVAITKHAFSSLKRILEEEDECKCCPYLRQFRARNILADVCWHGIPTFEQQKCHAQAVEMLSLLIKSFPDHRRIGKWYVRLIIDLKHLKRNAEAAEAAEHALANTFVDGGDRITIAKAMHALEQGK